jgi:hypothetical protein
MEINVVILIVPVTKFSVVMIDYNGWERNDNGDYHCEGHNNTSSKIIILSEGHNNNSKIIIWMSL